MAAANKKMNIKAIKLKSINTIFAKNKIKRKSPNINP
jgi:hypothetical protein